MSGTSDDPGLSGTAPPREFDLLQFSAKHAALLFLILLVLAFGFLTDGRFLHPLNLFNILRQVSIAGLVAIGMTFVILSAGIDLSVGALLAFAGLVGAFVSKGGFADRFAVGADAAAGNPWFLAMAAAIGADGEPVGETALRDERADQARKSQQRPDRQVYACG